jgi:hypothetical protein
MKRRVYLVVLTVVAFALSLVVQAQEIMTAQRFREITSSPGDNVPLEPNLRAVGPIWTNAAITVDLTYADGKKFKEVIAGSVKTVKGKYVVSTVNSSLYKKPMDSITAYDEKAGCYKYWGMLGETITEGMMVFDTDKKIYATYSAFSPGAWELGVSCYTDTNIWSHSILNTNGVFYCTRDVTVVPVKATAK